jgi:PTH1 family peptidyl-tRNA hydrolase
LEIIWNFGFEVWSLFPMKIIVGLGNPGRKYERTRHNAGFMAVDELAKNLQADVAHDKYHAQIGKARIDSEAALLAKPQTFMNGSGRSVAAILRETYSAVSDLIVVHDELDLPLGTVRVKIGGGHGGHNGLRSLIDNLGSPDFARVRVGIGRPGPDRDPADYVLSPFLAEEKQLAAEAVAKAAEAVRLIVKEGPAGAMNSVNKK